ncbi:alpha/beta hydrolase family protein [Paenibacillus soyae]|uniref:Dienelactone hydrolase family protein n=1 Tax=Paenibacillus soyae TaxID=2969249 RepID=A0A9X2MPW8_9BACL|nr:dienelactone hydrolase family protein [Paenibacillus soyae]MCR2804684.1 dienelactone hydrolase family protein [Paenibacillus soyae]
MSEQTLRSESFEIPLSGGLKVRGRVKTQENGVRKPVVVVAHGFRGFQDWGFWPDVTERFAEAGLYAVSFDFSRIAASEEGLNDARVAEASTLSQDVLDLGAVVRQLWQGQLPLGQEADPARIALLGHSRSGGSSIVFANENPELVGAVIVWNGGPGPVKASTDSDLTKVQLAVALDYESNPERFDITSRFSGLRQPALIVQGDRDSERLLEFVDKLKEIAPHQSYVSIQGADHTFGIAHPYEGSNERLDAAFEETVAFLKRTYPLK